MAKAHLKSLFPHPPTNSDQF